MTDCKKVRKSTSEFQLPIGKELNTESFQLEKDGSISISNRDIVNLIQTNVRDVIAGNQDLASIKVGVSVDF